MLKTKLDAFIDNHKIYRDQASQNSTDRKLKLQHRERKRDKSTLIYRTSARPTDKLIYINICDYSSARGEAIG